MFTLDVKCVRSQVHFIAHFRVKHSRHIPLRQKQQQAKPIVTNRIPILQALSNGAFNEGIMIPFSLAPPPGVPSDPGRACRVSGS